MFLLVVTSAEGMPIRFPFRTTEVTIGRAEGNDLVLPAELVSRRHMRIVIKDNKMIAVDLKSTHGTFINGKRMAAPQVVRETDEIRIDEYTLTCRAIDVPAVTAGHRAADPVEEALIRAIEDADEASRHVYADWLEERGDQVRAEFLRIQETLAAGTEVERTRHDHRLLELSLAIDVHWRARVGRSAIERCTFEFECPKHWSELARTDHPGVRYCAACTKTVHYCVTVPEAKAHARQGACVALDLTASRWQRDLVPGSDDLCRSCGADIGPGHRTCPQCGADPWQHAMVGRLEVRR